MKNNSMGQSSNSFPKAKNVHTGLVQDSTSKVRSIINGTQKAVASVHKAAKGGCKGC